MQQQPGQPAASSQQPAAFVLTDRADSVFEQGWGSPWCAGSPQIAVPWPDVQQMLAMARDALAAKQRVADVSVGVLAQQLAHHTACQVQLLAAGSEFSRLAPHDALQALLSELDARSSSGGANNSDATAAAAAAAADEQLLQRAQRAEVDSGSLLEELEALMQAKAHVAQQRADLDRCTVGGWGRCVPRRRALLWLLPCRARWPLPNLLLCCLPAGPTRC